MVRTRHSIDNDENEVSESPKFLSLNRDILNENSAPKERSHERSRRAYQDDEYSLFEDQVMDSRLRPRTGPRRAYNYLDAVSSDDDEVAFRKRHSTVENGNHDLSAAVDQDVLDQSGYRRSSRRRHHVIDESETVDQNIRRSSREHRQRWPVAEQKGRRTVVKHEIKKDKESTDDGQKEQDADSSVDEEPKDQDESDEEEKDRDSDNNENEEFSDIYSRVKRKRIQIKRDMYGNEILNRNNNQGGSERVTKRNSSEIVKSYSLREHKPRTDLYKAPVEERRIKKNTNSVFEVTPTKKTGPQPYQSPAQRRRPKKRSAMNSSSSSTSSSSGEESNDEKSFKKRKAKSMAKARSRMLPMNISDPKTSSNIIKDRIKSGASLADVEPMNIDKNVTFDSIGGLGKHIRSLKEMVVFPLLYDSVFQRFNVDPPRGVLFYGPPGTGKTLVARALANECSHGDKRVAFFMRKGADCLSKWVGESERQLRLLFDQAYKFRPSIIFFDEIDGLAPVRSSRQDQIHSSIVSTLLALMDGLDSRGEIVVIGATNRIDSLDPALRRPGRFDREFLFPLPTLEARKQILRIHTASWTPKLNEAFITELAEKCVGYCGADLKALCTEAAMLALRRRYPQIYMSNEALQLDEKSINVSAKDFFNAINNIIPTSRRSVSAPGRPLSLQVLPLLSRQLDNALNVLCDTFPPCHMKMSASNAPAANSTDMIWDELASDEDEDSPSIFVTPASKNPRAKKGLGEPGCSKDLDAPPSLNTYLNIPSTSMFQPLAFRPRLLLTGSAGQGQTSYLAPAMLHKLEDLPVHVLDLPALYAVTAKTPEESCATVFYEAKRKCPSIIYMPYLNQWWDVIGDTLRTTLLTLIQDLDPSTQLLLLATSEQSYDTLDPQLQSMFSQMSGEVVRMSNPNAEERKSYFKDLILHHTSKAPPERKSIAKKMLEVLPKAAPVAPKELTKREMDALLEKEELTLMELRIFLRDVLHKLGSDKKFSIFTKPVNIDDAPDYYEVIENPMDLSSMMSKIDCHDYTTVRSFINDIDLICCNALEYNPDRGPMDKVIRHRACALKDTAYAIVKTELDKDFEKMCVEIEESRKRRGTKSSTVPNFIRTKPPSHNEPSTSRNAIPSYLDSNKPPRSIPEPEGERFSRRVRGIHIDPTPSLEVVEKIARSTNAASSPSKENKDKSVENSHQAATPNEQKGENGLRDNSDSAKAGTSTQAKAQTDPLHKRRQGNKCVWCKPKRRRPFKGRLFHPLLGKKRTSGQTPVQKKAVTGGNTPSSSVDQPLSINIHTAADSEQQISPVRKSTRLQSPPISTATKNVRKSSPSPEKEMDTAPDSLITSGTAHSAIEAVQSLPETSNQGPTESSISEKELPSGFATLLEKTAEDLDLRKNVVKRLDLDFGAVDSGAGSSLDGNGDSRDSTDNKLEEATSSSTSHLQNVNQNNGHELSSKSVTLVNEEPNKFVISMEQLSNLLERLVLVTEGFSVEYLEKLYSQLSQIIYRHRKTYDRTSMTKELEDKVTGLTKRIPLLSSSS